MFNKKILLSLSLTALTLNSFSQQEPNSGNFIKIDGDQLTTFISVFGGVRTDHEELVLGINQIYNSLNAPEELKNEIEMLLTYKKPGVLALFGPRGQMLDDYLATFIKFLGKHDKSLGHVRKCYLRSSPVRFLAEIVEFGTKNGFKFESAELDGYLTLTCLVISEKIPLESAIRMINCLPNLINTQDQYGFTPLMDAVHRNRLDLAKLFIEAKVNLEIKSTYEYLPSFKFTMVPKGYTALDIAILNDNLDSINALLHAGAECHNCKSTNKKVLQTLEEFKAQQKKTINSALNDELPQVLVNLVYEYLEYKKEKKNGE